jgi:hypothetical protein
MIRLTLAVSAALLAVLTFGAPARADEAGISAAQMRQLRALSAAIPIALPAYIPPGFHLKRFMAERDIVKNGVHSAPDNGYFLTYEDAQHHQISISAADSGFGDVGPDPTAFRRAYNVTSALLGTTKMQPYRSDSGHLSFTGLYIPLKHLGNNPNAMMNFVVDGLSPSDTQKVYQSLHVIR